MSQEEVEARAIKIVDAFTAKPPTQSEERLIQNLLDHPGGTCASLSALHGWKPNVWDMQFGWMIKDRIEWLPPRPRGPGKSGMAIPTREKRGDDGVLRYWMRPEAEAAFAALGFKSSKSA